MTQLHEMVIPKYAPALYASLGIDWTLIAVNDVIIADSLVMQQPSEANADTRVVSGLGRAIEGVDVITAVNASAEGVAQYCNILSPVRGGAITSEITALTGMAFMRLLGTKI